MGAASYSAAHEAEAVLLANRSEAEVFASWRQEVLDLSQIGWWVGTWFPSRLGIVIQI